MVDFPVVNDSILKLLRFVPTSTVIDVMWRKGWPMGYVEGARPLRSGQKMVGRAVTLRFVPARPDLAADKPKAELSPEYVAIERCGPNEILVVDAMGWQYGSVGGEIKFLRLRQLNAGGLVTDGGLRDSGIVKEYQFPVYSAGKTAKQGGAEFLPWQVNDVIQCGGALVRPGDVIVGDDDGVAVVPSIIADEVARHAQEYEHVEEIVKSQLETERCSPGKYYPFNDNTSQLYEEKVGRKPFILS